MQMDSYLKHKGILISITKCLNETRWCRLFNNIFQGVIDLKLLQIRLLVKDFKKSAMFYRDLLEFPVSWYEEDMEYALFNNGETKVELVSRKMMAELVGEGDKPLEGESQSRFLLQFEVEDVDNTYKRFREKGINFVTEPHERKEWRAYVAHFRDPDDNLIEIYKML